MDSQQLLRQSVITLRTNLVKNFMLDSELILAKTLNTTREDLLMNMDKKLTKSRGGNPQKWWNNVENFSQRADWAIIENRNYIRKIIYEHQSIYGDWGRYYICEENQETK